MQFTWENFPVLGVLSLLVVTASLLSARQIAAGENAAGCPASPVWDLTSSHAVARVKVEAVTNKDAPTNANPPRLRIGISEILRGDPPDRRAEAIWTPPHHDIDWAGADADNLRIAWGKKSCASPQIGSEWIVCVYVTDGELRIGLRYTYSPDKLKWVEKQIAQQIAQRKKRELERQRERDRNRKEDLAIERKADLAKLCREATDVVVAERSSGGAPVLTLLIHQRVKDSRQAVNEKQKYLCVSIPKEAEQMIERRLISEDGSHNRLLVFLRKIPPTRDWPPSYLTNVDKRLFGFVDPENGMLPFTKERMEMTKAAGMADAKVGARETKPAEQDAPADADEPRR